MLKLALVVLMAVAAYAHIGVSPANVLVNVNTKIAFTVGHACDHDETTSVVFTVPHGITAVPFMKPGFALTTTTRPDPILGATTTGTITFAARSADSYVPNSALEEFILRIRPHQSIANGTAVPFPMEQICTTAISNWNSSDHHDSYPAPAFTVFTALPASAGSGSGSGSTVVNQLDNGNWRSADSLSVVALVLSGLLFIWTLYGAVTSWAHSARQQGYAKTPAPQPAVASSFSQAMEMTPTDRNRDGSEGVKIVFH